MLNKSPLNIELIQKDNFKISLKIGNWELSQVITENELLKLKEQINDASGLTKLSETFNCNGVEAQTIKDFWNELSNRKTCQECKFRMKDCYDCVIKCESPLERDLFLELRKNEINPVLQRRINKNGTYSEFPTAVDFKQILTVPDFYIEKEQTKICVYADGHTYHNRTEEQALRDRNIDRELQKLGYLVLRYTGQEIRKNCSLVVENIKASV
jgi:very-short-patch-repair endonuclease